MARCIDAPSCPTGRFETVPWRHHCVLAFGSGLEHDTPTHDEHPFVTGAIVSLTGLYAEHVAEGIAFKQWRGRLLWDWSRLQQNKEEEEKKKKQLMQGIVAGLLLSCS